MSVFAFYAQYIVIMASILIPVFVLVIFVVYYVLSAVQNKRAPLDGLKDALAIISIFFQTHVVSVVTALWIKYFSRHLYLCACSRL